MRLPSLVVAVLLTATLLSGTAAATGNAPPLADAGLDQTVPANATVYLDANGTRDPDGTIARVEWSVETPSGATTSPDCRACRQTHFRPTVVGQYNVTVTVTDDDGATRSDTLHVVVSPSSGPSVSLTGPGTVTRDDAATFTADTEGTDTTLSTLAWVVDGNVTDRTSLSGENASVSTTHAFGDAGTRSVRAVVYDAVGRRGTATKRVVVVTDGSVGGTLSDGGSSSDDCHFWNNDCPGDVVLTDSTTGEQTIVEGNGDGGIQMWVGGEYVTASKYVDVDQFRTDDISGGYEYGALEQAVETRKNLEDAWMDGSRGGQVESSGGSSEAGSVTSGSSGDPYYGSIGGNDDSGSSNDDSGSTFNGGSPSDHYGSSGGNDDSNDFGSGGTGSGLFAGGTGGGSGHEPIDDSGSSSSSGSYSGGSPSDHYGSSGGGGDSGGSNDPGGSSNDDDSGGGGGCGTVIIGGVCIGA